MGQRCLWRRRGDRCDRHQLGARQLKACRAAGSERPSCKHSVERLAKRRRSPRRFVRHRAEARRRRVDTAANRCGARADTPTRCAVCRSTPPSCSLLSPYFEDAISLLFVKELFADYLIYLCIFSQGVACNLIPSEGALEGHVKLHRRTVPGPDCFASTPQSAPEPVSLAPCVPCAVLPPLAYAQ